MSESSTASSAKKSAAPGKRRSRLPLILGGAVVVLGLAGGGAWVFVPGLADSVKQMAGLGGATPAAPAAAPATAAPAPALPQVTFIDLPEFSLTLPNGGRPRQLRLSLAVEVSGEPAQIRPRLTNPRIYDALILYLRTLRDGELEGALAIDRLRGDLFRRLDLLLGPNVVRDVLITGFVMA